MRGHVGIWGRGLPGALWSGPSAANACETGWRRPGQRSGSRRRRLRNCCRRSQSRSVTDSSYWGRASAPSSTGRLSILPPTPCPRPPPPPASCVNVVTPPPPASPPLDQSSMVGMNGLRRKRHVFRAVLLHRLLRSRPPPPPLQHPLQAQPCPPPPSTWWQGLGNCHRCWIVELASGTICRQLGPFLVEDPPLTRPWGAQPPPPTTTSPPSPNGLSCSAGRWYTRAQTPIRVGDWSRGVRQTGQTSPRTLPGAGIRGWDRSGRGCGGGQRRADWFGRCGATRRG